MKSRLMFILVMFLYPLTGQALYLTGTDLLSIGALTITENTQIVITEDITWNGAINAGGGFTVDFLNQGSLLGNVSIQSSDSALFNLRNEGAIAANINFNTAGATTNVDTTFGNLSGYLNFNIQDSASVNFLAGGYLESPSVNIQNSSGKFDFQNNGYVGSIFNVTNTGDGVVNFLNNGSITADLNINTYGGDTNIMNNGWYSGTLNILDQHDDTSISNNGTISAATLNFTANGGMGSIQLQNNGDIGSGSNAYINANYGGGIIFNTMFGTMDLSGLSVSAGGSSHGVDSSFLMIYDLNVDVNELYVYGTLQDASFLTAGLDRMFANPNDGSFRVVFDNTEDSPAPVPEPATMLLLGSSLVGLWGARRLRGTVN